MSSSGVSRRELGNVVQLAALAPSLHGSQPWQFVVGDGRLELYANPTRSLSTPEPEARQVIITCGAALLHVRLGLRSLGYEPTVHVMPDPMHADHLARIEIGIGAPSTACERTLVAAMFGRCEPESGQKLSSALRQELLGEVRAEGAELQFLPGLLAVLWVVEDDTVSQLRAGQALARLLLTAVVRGVPASVVDPAAADMPSTRALIHRTGVNGHPKALVRLGKGAQQPVTWEPAVQFSTV